VAHLRCANVVLAFGAHVVLDGANLAVHTGDRAGIIAPNGVGKSTLLRVAAGELAPKIPRLLAAPAGTARVTGAGQGNGTGHGGRGRGTPTDARQPQTS
jgi:ATPase subunit of ABC transporter with duplicated ATPase domains